MSLNDGHAWPPGEADISLTVDQATRIATVSIDRPAKRNAMSLQMWQVLGDIAEYLVGADADAVVITATGEHFSAGADISEFEQLRTGLDQCRMYSASVARATDGLARIPVPTVATIDGSCVGGGCEIAVACDIRLATGRAEFGITPAKLGIVYSLASTKRLVDAVGTAWARYILLTGELLTSDRAFGIGLVHEVVDAPDLPARLEQLVPLLTSRAQVSQIGAKAIMNLIANGAAADSPQSAEIYDSSYVSGEYREGARAFAERRPPNFVAVRANDRNRVEDHV